MQQTTTIQNQVLKLAITQSAMNGFVFMTPALPELQILQQILALAAGEGFKDPYLPMGPTALQSGNVPMPLETLRRLSGFALAYLNSTVLPPEYELHHAGMRLMMLGPPQRQLFN